MTEASDSQKPRCLVTGATGFVGSHLSRRLIKLGYPVHVLVRRRSMGKRVLADLSAETFIGDLTDPASIVRAMSGCDYVFHCAAMVSDWGTVREIRRANVQGTAHVVDAAVQTGVRRLVHVSSTDVYGYPGRAKVDETSPLVPHFTNWYAQTKAEAERIVTRAGEQHGLATVIIRPSTIYGPGSWHVIGEIAKALRSDHMLMIGNGKTRMGLCYIDNLLDALVAAMDCDAAAGAAFNIADASDMDWQSFLMNLSNLIGCHSRLIRLPYSLAWTLGLTLELGYRVLRQVTGLRCKALLSRQAVQIMGIDQDFSIDKAKRILGYEPKVDVLQGLLRTSQWVCREVLADQ